MSHSAGYHARFRLSIRIPDWRSDLSKLHKLNEMLFIMVVALIAGAQDCEGDPQKIVVAPKVLHLPHDARLRVVQNRGDLGVLSGG